MDKKNHFITKEVVVIEGTKFSWKVEDGTGKTIFRGETMADAAEYVTNLGD